METNKIILKQNLDARFVEALQTHRHAMYRVAYTMLKSSGDAEDAVSIATVNAYQASAHIRSWDSIKAYLLRVTVNAAHTILRKRKREVVSEVDILLATHAVQEDTPIWMYTQALPLPMRTVLHLRYGEDMPLMQIARVLHIPKGTVSSRLIRAQNELKRLMERRAPNES